MISSNLQQVVRSAAEEFGVEAVWLFGSAAEDEASARDIDLAVEGLARERFFITFFRSELSMASPT